MGGQVHFVPGSSLKTSGGQTDGMTRANALTGVSDQLCSSSQSHDSSSPSASRA